MNRGQSRAPPLPGEGTIVGEEPNDGYQVITAGILLRLVPPHFGIRTLVPLTLQLIRARRAP